MRIIFDLYGVGLGNNGGSRTLVRCGETLATLGHCVIMFGPNKYSWHKPHGIKFVTSGDMPNADVIIATGYRSVPSVVHSSISRKFYFIRGFETWVTSRKNLIKSYKSLQCIVNSSWLSLFLKKHDIPCHLVYPGLDFDWFFDEKMPREPILGALFHNRHKTKRHCDAISVSKETGYKLIMLNKTISHASPSDTRSFYNNVMVWISPSELEGFHNPPAESVLCGCALVATDHKRGGVNDYAIDGETALIYPSRDIRAASQCVKRLVGDMKLRIKLTRNCQELLRTKIGTRKSNMIRLSQILGG